MSDYATGFRVCQAKAPRRSVRWSPARLARGLAWALLGAAAWVAALHPGRALGQAEPAAKTPSPEVECLSIDKKLPAELTAADRKRFIDMRDSGRVEPGGADVIDRVVRYELYRFTWPEHRQQIGELRVALLASMQEGPQFQQFRREVAAAIIRHAPALLDNHCFVRLNAMILLASLRDPEDLEQAVRIMLNEIRNPKQTHEVKLHACMGIQRLAQSTTGFHDLRLRIEVVAALPALLRQNDRLHPRFPEQVMETIAALRQSGENGDAAQTLLEVVHDEAAEPRERAYAADAIGQLDVSGLKDFNYELVAHELAKLTASLAQSYLEHYDELEQSQQLSWWQYYFYRVLRGFRGDRQRTGLLQMARGLEKENFQFVKEAHDGVTAVAKALVEEDLSKASEELKKLRDWIDQHLPKDRRLTGGLAPLPDAGAAAPAAAARKEN